MEEEKDYSFYNDSDIMEDLQNLSFRVQLTSSAMFTLIAVVGVIANGLVVYKVVRHKHLRTKNNFFIANLAAADAILLIALIIPKNLNFFTALKLHSGPPLAVVQYIQHVCIQATSVILVFMSFSRYTTAMFPLRARAEWTALRVWLCCAGSWLVSTVIYIPLLFGILATPKGESNSLETKLFAIITMFLLFIIPFCMIVFCYAGIMISFRKGRDTVRRSFNNNTDPTAYQSRKLTRMVLIIICVFFISLAPIQSYMTWLACREHNKATSSTNWRILEILGFCTRLTAYLGSTINPFIYAYANPSFQESNMFRLRQRSTLTRSTPV